MQATEVKTTVYVDDSRFRHHNARKLKRAVHQAEESEVKKKKSSFVFVVFVTFAVEIVITRPDRERTRGELGNAGRDESQSALALGRALACWST